MLRTLWATRIIGCAYLIVDGPDSSFFRESYGEKISAGISGRIFAYFYAESFEEDE